MFEAIDSAITALKSNGLILKVVEGLQVYLSCQIKFSKDKKRAWLGQPHLIKNMEKNFGEDLQDVWSHKTSGMPKLLIVRPMIGSEKNSTDNQWKYQSGVGMLLYLVKHSHLNLANMSRELSKVNNGSNPATYKELLHVIKYVLDTNNLGLKIESMGNSN